MSKPINVTNHPTRIFLYLATSTSTKKTQQRSGLTNDLVPTSKLLATMSPTYMLILELRIIHRLIGVVTPIKTLENNKRKG